MTIVLIGVVAFLASALTFVSGFGLGTLLLANWKTRKPPAGNEKPPIDGEARR